MEIIIAKTAGFCFGVNKAVNSAYSLLKETDKQIYTLGPIIHNEHVVNNLKSLGIKVVDKPEEIDNQGNVIIRAHGVSPDIYEQLKVKNVTVIDATCPYVKKIHNLVSDMYKKGYHIIIVGDKTHPEVIGVNGWCNNTASIIDSLEDVEEIDKTVNKVCIVAQTTITREKWETINEYLKKLFQNIIKFDTICNATSQRQIEAAEISKNVDLMFVIGSKSSSNTQKLFNICKKCCIETYQIETIGDIPPMDIKKIKKIGITAGASTPEWMIKEVIEKMSELNIPENELSFKEAFENSLVTLQTGQVVKGKIIGFNNAEIFVDLGYKSDGIILVEEYTDDPDFSPAASLKVGEEIDVFVVRVNDGEGNVLLSKKKVDTIKGWDKINEAFENKTTIQAKVIDVVSGGVLASTNGIRIFIPASQISDRYVKDLKEFLKQTVRVRIIEFNKQKKKIVGSQRVILEEEKAHKVIGTWEGMEVGKTYKGVVKSFMDFGAFVDIGGVDGLIHISELSWSKVKHPSDVLKIGSEVEVTVKEFDKEKSRISLGYRKLSDNPWHNAEEKYKVGEIINGKIARLVPFGAFVEINPGVDGLVHISQISNVRITKPGDVLQVGQIVEAKIIEANFETKKINLSIKEVTPIDPVSDKKEEAKASKTEEVKPEDVVPTEHKEEMNVSIKDLIKEK